MQLAPDARNSSLTQHESSVFRYLYVYMYICFMSTFQTRATYSTSFNSDLCPLQAVHLFGHQVQPPEQHDAHGVEFDPVARTQNAGTARELAPNRGAVAFCSHSTLAVSAAETRVAAASLGSEQQYFLTPREFLELAQAPHNWNAFDC